MSDEPRGASRLWAWLEDRLGVGSAAARWAAIPVPAAGGWWRTTGGVLALLVAAQFVSGVALASFYSPSVTTAWESVHHLEERVLLGAFLRGFHAFGASAVVIVALLHGVRVALQRRYLPPRDALWWIGLACVPLLAAFALTGYLLPWDQRGYWSTQVAAGIVRATPLVGGAAAQVFRGGGDLGNLTLTRFFTLHTVLLPAALGLGGALALVAWRRAAEAERPRPAGRYFPGQAARDALVGVGALAAVAALGGLVGAGLAAPADPGVDFAPRPEWYFAPLRELLRWIPEPWGSVVLPGAVFAGLAALPWIDRRRGPAAARAVVLAPLCGWLLLLSATTWADLRDAGFQQQRALAARDAALARELASAGVPPGGAAELLRRHPPRLGAALFEEHCRRCHPLDGEGGDEAPDLTGYLSDEWLQGVIRAPRSPRFFGRTSLHQMDDLPEAAWPDVPDVAAYVASLDPTRTPPPDPAAVERGRAAYRRLECGACHRVDEGRADLGPNLFGYGSPAWLEAFLRDPGDPLFYAEDNDMPAYGEELSDEELRALVVFLRELSVR